MLDNYPPGFDHSRLDGETREQQEAIEVIETAQECYKACMRAVADVLSKYAFKKGLAPDCFEYLGDSLGDMLHDSVKREIYFLRSEGIDASAWPDNHKQLAKDLYEIVMG